MNISERQKKAFITKNIYNEHYNTFKSFTNSRKMKRLFVLSADKESCTVTLNNADYVSKVKLIKELPVDNMLKQVILHMQI